MVQYGDAMKSVKPKQIELAEAKRQSTDAQILRDTALEKLREVQEQMRLLVEKHDS